jgi:hypothetical protein
LVLDRLEQNSLGGLTSPQRWPVVPAALATSLHRLHRTNAHTGGADRPRNLLSSILTTPKIEHVDVAAAELTSLKSVGLAHRRLDPVASLDVLDARSGVTLGVYPPQFLKRLYPYPP